MSHAFFRFRTRLENGADHWHQLMLSLRELVEWVVKKETELGAQPQIGTYSFFVCEKYIVNSYHVREKLFDASRLIEVI